MAVGATVVGATVVAPAVAVTVVGGMGVAVTVEG
jgi:hypothetical protein